MKFPSSTVDIDTLEDNNEGNLSVNVYYLDPGENKQSIALTEIYNPLPGVA